MTTPAHSGLAGPPSTAVPADPADPLRPLDNALQALTDTAHQLLGADSSVAIVWDERRHLGCVRARSGQSAAFIGQAVGPEAALYESVAPPFLVQTAGAHGPDDGAAAVITVPIDNFLPTRTLLTASWNEPKAPEELARAEEGLRALTRLTKLSYAAELELARMNEQAQLEAVLECVGDGVWLETAEGPKVNRAGRTLLELDEGETVEELESTLKNLDGTAISQAEQPRVRANATRTTVPFLLQRASKNGELRIFQGTAAPVYSPAGMNPVGSLVIFRDATEEYNRNLLTERFLEQLFEALPLAVGVADPATGQMLSVNQAFVDLVGFTPEQMIGTPPPHPWWGEAPAIQSVPTPRPVEALFRRPDGRLIPVELVSFLVSEANGAPAAAVTLVTDLSERRRFEQQMVQSGRLAAIGELAAGVAHEINNPLFAILGLIEFLLKEVEPGTKAHERLKLIQQTGLEIKDVVRALLDFARERPDELELVSLPEVLEQTIDLVRRTSLRKEIELIERYPDEPVLVLASAGQLKQVVLNIVTNAQQAMPGAGAITIELAREGDRAVVRVTDTGPGIAPEVLARIFDPFFTTKRAEGGTGLGLSLSQSIVDAHGGTLAAASPSGAGAEFTIVFPLGETA